MLPGIPFPVAPEALVKRVNYACLNGCSKLNHVGDLILGSSLITNILLLLHTGQRQGSKPISHTNFWRFVSGGGVAFLTTPGFSSGANRRAWFCLAVWLQMLNRLITPKPWGLLILPGITPAYESLPRFTGRLTPSGKIHLA